jgi:hypothetical protein
MAVIVLTTTPAALLQSMKDEIRARSIQTWSVDADGDFTHTAEQWIYKAWFRPTLHSDRLIFKILTPKGSEMTRSVYAIYHGRFIEMLLRHFDLRFEEVKATALPGFGDIIRPS